MKSLFRVFRVIALVAAVAAIVAAQPGMAANFSDNFNRADGAIGNGWTVTPSAGGGPYGGGSIPTAVISGNQVEMDRNGWGNDMWVSLAHTFDAATTVQADMSYALVAGGVDVNIVATAASGATITVRSWDDASVGPCIAVALSSDGGWHDWTTYAQPFGGYTGTATYKITTDGVGGIVVDVSAGGTTLWNRGFALSAPSFTSGGVYADWATWTNGTTAYADNFAATSVPEPSSFLALATLLPFVLIRRKK